MIGWEIKNMAVAYTPSGMVGVPEDAILGNTYWHYYLILKADFKKTLQYVHLSSLSGPDDHSNLKTYSLELAKQLISIAAEFETIAQLLCKQINGVKVGNMGQYKENILPKFPKMWSTPVFIDQYKEMIIYPLKPWESPGGTLAWWDAYGFIKHRRHLYFEKATLENVLHALGSLLILESYLYQEAYPKPHNIRYGSNLLRVPGLGEPVFMTKGHLPDF